MGLTAVYRMVLSDMTILVSMGLICREKEREREERVRVLDIWGPH
jgi:hypothetical protein